MGSKAITHTRTLAGRMRGMSIKPSKKAKKPNSIKVDEMPNSRDANPKIDNLGVLRVLPAGWLMRA